MKQFRKPLLIVLIIACALLLGAVLLGVLNATVGGGEWMLGWQDYRYEDADAYECGGATVYSEEIRSIEIDWLRGEVELMVSEDDRYLSVSESSKEALPSSAQVRWHLDVNGRLTVRFRESSVFFATGIREKKLTVRVPKSLAQELSAVSVKGGNCSVTVSGLTADSVNVSTEKGEISVLDCEAKSLSVTSQKGNAMVTGLYTEAVTVSGKRMDPRVSLACCPKTLTLSVEQGRVELSLPESSSFALSFSSEEGSMISELPLREENGRQVHGNGDCVLTVSVERGEMLLKKAD